MDLSHEIQGREIIIYFSGELDHYHTRKVINYTERMALLYPKYDMVLDMKQLNFMDSSGIAVVIYALKGARANGRKLLLRHVPKFAYKIFNAAGLCKLVEIHPWKGEE